MAWSYLTGKLSKEGADDSRIPLVESVRLMTNGLVGAGSAQRIGDTTFVNCKDHYVAIKDDGSIEFGEGAA